MSKINQQGPTQFEKKDNDPAIIIKAGLLSENLIDGAIENNGNELFFVVGNVRHAISKSLERQHAMNNNISYCGIAPKGSLVTDYSWTIKKIVINNDGTNTITTAIGVRWIDYLTTNYI